MPIFGSQGEPEEKCRRSAIPPPFQIETTTLGSAREARMLARVKRLVVLIGSAVAVLGGLAPSAQATFPGKNGKIAFVGAPVGLGPYEIHAVNPDGTQRGRLIP